MTSPLQQKTDERYMQQALLLASEADLLNEVPVGAIVVLDDQIVGKGFNRCVTDSDPSGHAEIVALRQAAARMDSFRLDGATLYVTLEPCLMCCGALLQARIQRLVFGAREPRTGAVVSVHEALRLPRVDHHVAITEGVLASESSTLLKQFFEPLR